MMKVGFMTKWYIIPCVICFVIFSVTLFTGCDNICDCSKNNAPVVNEILATPQSVTINQNGYIEPVIVTAVATDKDGDPLKYNWSCSVGKIETGLSDYSTTTNPARWNPPNTRGNYSVTCTVSDGKETNKKSINITVK